MNEIWNTEDIFFDGDSYFERLIEDIDNARSYITFEMYMFNDDVLGKKISEHLIKAQQRGVKVQIVIDGIGSFNFINGLHADFIKSGVNVKIYNPIPFYHPYVNEMTWIQKISVLSARIWRLNRRNHRKIITIDYKILYLGSFNITAEHTKYHKENAWKDMGVRVTGDHVNFAILNFKKVWKFKDYFRFKRKNRRITNINWRTSPVRLNQTVFMRRFFYKNLLWRIHRAQKRIWLMTPYFIPKRSLIKAIGQAASRGVEVKILISHKTDVKLFKWLQYFYYPYLIKKGASIHQYEKSILHAKNYIIDDFITIGSSNLNHRSLIHDLEVDMIIQNKINRNKIETSFLNSLQSQRTITLEYLKKRPVWDRLLSRLIFIFKYWF